MFFIKMSSYMSGILWVRSGDDVRFVCWEDGGLMRVEV